MINGGCFCGAIRYAIEDGDYIVANCHCTMCRKTSAAAFVTWIVVPQSQFQYTKGTPETLQSSKSGTRYFCGTCGTPILCSNSDHPKQVDITTGSLDDPGRFPPKYAVFEDTKLEWLSTTELPSTS